jgi:hypothetical protein
VVGLSAARDKVSGKASTFSSKTESAGKSPVSSLFLACKPDDEKIKPAGNQ